MAKVLSDRFKSYHFLYCVGKCDYTIIQTWNNWRFGGIHQFWDIFSQFYLLKPCFICPPFTMHLLSCFRHASPFNLSFSGLGFCCLDRSEIITQSGCQCFYVFFKRRNRSFFFELGFFIIVRQTGEFLKTHPFIFNGHGWWWNHATITCFINDFFLYFAMLIFYYLRYSLSGHIRFL